MLGTFEAGNNAPFWGEGVAVSVKPGHWAQGLGQQSASMRPGSLGRANSNRTLNPLSSHNVSSRHGFGVQSHGRAVGEASTSTETQSGDVAGFKDRPADLFSTTNGRYAKAAWRHAIAAVPEGTQFRPVTDLLTHESVSSRYGPSEVNTEPSQRRSTTPTLPRPGLNAASTDRVVRRPLTEAASTAVLADAVTQTVCEASAQTVEEDPGVSQDRVIRIPWGGRPDGSTPVIVPIKEAKALTKCTVRTSRCTAKKAGAARQKKGTKNRINGQEHKSNTDRKALKEHNSDAWTLPLTPKKAAQPRRHSGKPSRIESAKTCVHRPRSANAAVPAVKPASSITPHAAPDVRSPQRCTACGSCSAERPQSAVSSPPPVVQDSPRALQPLQTQPCTPGPTAAALHPASPPLESAAVLPPADQDSPRSLSVFGGGCQQHAVPVVASYCEHVRGRPPCQPHPHMVQPDLARTGITHSHTAQECNSPSHSSQYHGGGRPVEPKTSRDALEATVLHNPERQDMVSQLERALADLERDVSQRASEICSEAAPAFNSGLDSLAALEAEISDQHRRLADIGVVLPSSSRKDPGAVHKQLEQATVRTVLASESCSVSVVGSLPPAATPSTHCAARGVSPGQTWPEQILTGVSLGELASSSLRSDTPSSVSPLWMPPHRHHDRPVASSVSGSELRSSNYDASAAIAYLSQAPTSSLHSDVSELPVPGAARSGRSNSHPGSRPHSASPDGKFSSVSIEDRLTSMGLSEQISQLVRDISAETDSVCSLPQSTQDSFPWLRGVATNSDTSSTVTLPPLAPPQPLSSRDCLRPSSASPDALSDCPSSSIPSRDHEWHSLSASGAFHTPSTSAAPLQSGSSPSPPPLPYELTFAPAGLGEQLRALSPLSEASTSPASSPTVAGKNLAMRNHPDEREPPFHLYKRAPSHTNGDDPSDRTSAQREPATCATSTPCHSNSVDPSSADGPVKENSPERASRASSARSASLNPAAGSSWRGNTEDRESLTSRSQSPDFSARTPSTRTPERDTRDGDLSFLSPMSASDLGESASVTATPTDLVAEVDSILCPSFWAS